MNKRNQVNRVLVLLCSVSFGMALATATNAFGEKSEVDVIESIDVPVHDESAVSETGTVSEEGPATSESGSRISGFHIDEPGVFEPVIVTPTGVGLNPVFSSSDENIMPFIKAVGFQGDRPIVRHTKTNVNLPTKGDDK